MKRELDLIREILLYIEERQAKQRFSVIIEGHSEIEVALHLKWLDEAGFIDAVNLTNTTLWHVHSLTWQGLDYLDAIRDPGVWGKVKKKLLDVGGTATVEIVKALGQEYLKQKLGVSS